MNKTPNSNRIHIALFGKRNAGKSSLMNAITGQETSVVSPVMGTTTDPVRKAMELIPLGPAVFIDTAGIDDEGALGNKRVEQSMKVLGSTDFAIYVMDAMDTDEEHYSNIKRLFKKRHTPHLLVINKIDTVEESRIDALEQQYADALLISALNTQDVLLLKSVLIERLQKMESEERTMIGDIVPYNGKVIMVVPIDSEAPKGRLILPQVQFLRDALDHGITCTVTRDTELESTLKAMGDVDLVVTDSQAFKTVHPMVPNHIQLTSFSIVMSRIKGDLLTFIESVRRVDDLPDGARIFVAETCTHNSTCEDIGRVKIPRGLDRYTGKKFQYDIMAGRDFPTDLSPYDLVIHCASCMLNRKAMQTRIAMCKEAGVPITNYGILLSYINGIVDRATKVFHL